MKLWLIGVLVLAASQLIDCCRVKWKLRSCAQAYNGTDGVYKIKIENRSPTQVFCISDRNKSERAWTVVIRRNGGSEDFDRNLNDYERGFGDLDKDYFIGLQMLHAMTNSKRYELWIRVVSDSVEKNARYDQFAIGGPNQNYILHTLGVQLEDVDFDSFRTQSGNRFSTKDKDFTAAGCPSALKGGWWFYESSWYKGHDCSDICLTTKYNNNVLPQYTYHDFGVNGNPGVKTAVMAIRPYQISK